MLQSADTVIILRVQQSSYAADRQLYIFAADTLITRSTKNAFLLHSYNP